MTSHDHDHDHDDHTKPPSDAELRVKALESLLVERQFVEPAARCDCRGVRDQNWSSQRRSRNGPSVGRSGLQGSY
jgi:hypothetical protein